ncbi:hypothetical protein CPLU01_07235 [Colletotrichum plurivorum]|uniref:Uncharacterized protein n=1 Tax=Colletotrichum plurivorum TaxID=2175906 RepID=A0A8H6KFG8_9PEZI|nr:hypothetical protein CPLU01_07235 [Colletotrichum plurivorum]
MVALNLTLLALSTPRTLGIVCARYKESLDPWAPVANITYVYAKGSVPQDNDGIPHSSFRSYIPLKNIGREGHTHLYHIVTYYDQLDEVMVFSQAEPFSLLSPVVNTTTQMAAKAMDVAVGDVTPFNEALFHDVDDWGRIDWNSSKELIWITPGQIATLKRAPFTPDEFWTRLLGGRHPPAIRAMHGGIFAVRRETIWSLPRSVYQRSLTEFEKEDAVNPEVGFFMERMWAPMFSRKYRLQSVESP